MALYLIAAMTKKRVIGKDNKLPWHISEDLKNFKRLTSGNTVIMGRKTFDSIGKPLPNRHNIVVSRSVSAIDGVDVCHSFEDAVEKAKSYGKDIFVIGGNSMYGLALPMADKMFISHVKKEYEGDAYFPDWNQDEWEVESQTNRSETEISSQQ